MRNFYEAPGWKSRSVGDECPIRVSGATLALYPLDALAEKANTPPREDAERISGFTRAIEVEGKEMVDAGIEAVCEAGGRVLAEPVARGWGGRWGYFADP